MIELDPMNGVPTWIWQYFLETWHLIFSSNYVLCEFRSKLNRTGQILGQNGGYLVCRLFCSEIDQIMDVNAWILHRIHQVTTHINIIWSIDIPSNHLKGHTTLITSRMSTMNQDESKHQHTRPIVLQQLHNFQDT